MYAAATTYNLEYRNYLILAATAKMSSLLARSSNSWNKFKLACSLLYASALLSALVRSLHSPKTKSLMLENAPFEDHSQLADHLAKTHKDITEIIEPVRGLFGPFLAHMLERNAEDLYGHIES